MIVSLEALKLALGIDDDDESEDDHLTAWEARAAAWVEGETHRKFSAPDDDTIEYQFGTGTRTLYLNGHLDDPDADIEIRERVIPGSWESVDEDDFERRGDAVMRVDGGCWDRNVEYELTYEDGYDDPPGDIQDLVIELVRGMRTTAAESAGEISSSDITDESIDGYSYSVGSSSSSSTSSASASAFTASDLGQATLDRWRRRRV